MTRLILTTDSSGAGALQLAGCAEVVIAFGFRFVWGPLPDGGELAAMLAPRTPQNPGLHWLDNLPTSTARKIGGRDLGLIEACARFDTTELWIDPDPNSQLTLICLLDHLRHHPKIAAKLTLVQADAAIGDHPPEEVTTWRPRAVEVSSDHLDAASLAWQAYRRPTPQDWFNLLGEDLSDLPQLRHSVLELLEELPMPATGLGATEMRMLKLISAGSTAPFDVFPGDKKPNQRRVFGYWEVGALLDGIAHCPAPAVSGLEEGPFTPEMLADRTRYERYTKSRLSLTALGEAILAQTEDFSRHNPIRRWWGGTELTNDHLWRWDPVSRALIAP